MTIKESYHPEVPIKIELVAENNILKKFKKYTMQQLTNAEEQVMEHLGRRKGL
jgi:hypothetical protein